MMKWKPWVWCCPVLHWKAARGRSVFDLQKCQNWAAKNKKNFHLFSKKNREKNPKQMYECSLPDEVEQKEFSKLPCRSGEQSESPQQRAPQAPAPLFLRQTSDANSNKQIKSKLKTLHFKTFWQMAPQFISKFISRCIITMYITKKSCNFIVNQIELTSNESNRFLL